MDEHPLSVRIDSEARLLISLSDEQLKDVAAQVAEILRRQP